MQEEPGNFGGWQGMREEPIPRHLKRARNAAKSISQVEKFVSWRFLPFRRLTRGAMRDEVNLGDFD